MYSTAREVNCKVVAAFDPAQNHQEEPDSPGPEKEHTHVESNGGRDAFLVPHQRSYSHQVCDSILQILQFKEALVARDLPGFLRAI